MSTAQRPGHGGYHTGPRYQPVGASYCRDWELMQSPVLADRLAIQNDQLLMLATWRGVSARVKVHKSRLSIVIAVVVA
jgi:hypothetical protein